MPIPFVDDYKEGVHNFPLDNIAFDKKGEQWHKDYANAVMQDYANNRCGVMYSERDNILTNRAYAEGSNSEDLYKDIVLEYHRDEQERVSFAAMDWTIIPVISKIKSVFIGILSGVDHRAVCNSIDPVSMRKKTIEKEKLWIKKVFAPEIAPIDEKLGIRPTEVEYVPQSRAELDMYDQFGGFKMGIEIAMEAGLKHCFETSRWDGEIRPQLLSDLFDNKMFACRDYLDPNTYTVKQEYVDIANIIVQSSASPKYDTSRYKGFIKFYTIADLRVATSDQPGWDEAKLKKIAQKYENELGNASVTWGNVNGGDTKGPFNESLGTSTYAYDPYLIPVAVLEVQSTMYEYDVERKDAAGNVSVYKTDRPRKDTETRKNITTAVKVWHKVSLVIGCNEIFDYGLQHDIPRPTYEDARSSFHFYRMKGKSYCERAIPHAKQIQLMYLKIQGLALKAVPPGVAVEWNALKNMIMNKRELDPFDVLKIYGQTGNLVYMDTNIRGRQTSGGGVPPIKELRGSYTLADLLGIVMHHKQEIREITGINDQGGRGEPTATGAKLSFMTTDIALKESYNAYIELVACVAINATARLRDLLSYSEEARTIYSPIIGLTNMELLNLVSDLPTAQIAVMIEIQPTDEDVQAIIDAAVAAMRPGKEGQPTLTYGEFMFVESMAKRGNLKYAQAYIAHKESEKEKMAIQRATQAKQMDTEMAVQVAQAKTQGVIQETAETEKIKTDEAIRLFNAQKEAEDIFAQKQHVRDMELERLKLNTKSMQTEPAI